MAKDYFPLVPGTKWVYSDSTAPGTSIEQTVLTEVAPEPVRVDAPTDPKIQVEKGEKIESFFPVEVRVNGALSGRPCFRAEGATLYLVGLAPNRPVVKRPILRVGIDEAWEYDSDPVSPIDPTPVHVLARAKQGPESAYFGKVRKTIVLTTDASVGGAKGLKIHQVAIYAQGVGMVSFSEDGTAGGKPIKHQRTLTRFEPKGPSN